jgi:(p)ppGpp synthase/HD superfamily hydrolase
MLYFTIMNPTLEKVKHFADQAHGDQRRKYSGERYITHPIRVMEMCMKYTDDDCMLAAALLHDVLEDTTVTERAMAEFLQGIMSAETAGRTLDLVIELTDVYTKKNYPGLNRRARKAKEADRLSQVSGDAQTIKYADIVDNATNIFIHDPDFATVFIQEGKWVLKRMLKGDPELYDRAMKVVNDCLELMDERQVMDKLK